MDIRCGRSANTLPRRAGKYGRQSIPGSLMLAGLLLCGGSIASTEAATQQILTTMPDTLLGAWHRNDDDGRRDCEAYRRIKSASDITEETGGLVGALMIARNLVHAYSDYGEGDFYVVKRVVKTGDQTWEVDALVGTDSMPSEELHDGEDRVRFTAVSGMLTMSQLDSRDGSTYASQFVRCGDVLEGMYPDQVDVTQ